MTNLVLNLAKDSMSTLANAFQILRRIDFVTTDLFSWGAYNPNINFNGMAVTNLVIRRARYIKIMNMLWFSLDFSATLAAPLGNVITTSLPFVSPNTNPSLNQLQGGGIMTNSGGGSFEAGFWWNSSGFGDANFSRTASANWGAGAARVICNGFIEVV